MIQPSAKYLIALCMCMGRLWKEVDWVVLRVYIPFLASTYLKQTNDDVHEQLSYLPKLSSGIGASVISYICMATSTGSIPQLSLPTISLHHAVQGIVYTRDICIW